MRRSFLPSFRRFGLLCLLLFLAGTWTCHAVTVSYDGGKSFSTQQLESAIAEQLHAINESGLAPAWADDAAFSLLMWYRKHGYSQAEVTWQIASPQHLILQIREGPITRLGSITFPGAKSLSLQQLHDYAVGATRERYSAIKNEAELPYVESDLKASVALIRGYYQSEGFLDVQVSDPVVKMSGDFRRADVSIPVQEGIQYQFGKITFDGDLVFFPPTDLLDSLKPFTTKPYTPNAVTQMERQVGYFYKSRGYFKVQVKTESDAAQHPDGIVPVHFHVESGDVYRFDGVTVTGLERLEESFIEKRFAKIKGKFYNPERLDDLFRDLMHTGLFTRLKIEPEALPNRLVQLHVDLEEAPAKELGFSVGYGTFEGPILGVSAGDRDLFGKGRPLTANIETSARYLRAEVLYLDPWFMDSDYSLRLRLYGITIDYDGFTSNELGLRADLTKKLTKNWEVGTFLLAREVQNSSTGIDPAAMGPGQSLITSIGLSQTLDFRDSPLNPRKGMILNMTGEYAADVLGHGIQFARASIRFSYYFPIKKTLLAVGIRSGALVPLNASDIPISERYFNGGSRSVRSFQERKLGPKDIHGYPVGGNTFTTLNIEYDIPIITNLDGALFVDAGSVASEWGRFPGEFGVGIGAGVRYRLPIGPLRLDAAMNPDAGRRDPWGAIHFSFGVAF